MEEQQRLNIYSFLSIVLADEMDEKFIGDLKKNKPFLEMISPAALEWFKEASKIELSILLNIDYNSLFFSNSVPLESEVRGEVQNTLNQFYLNHAFEPDLEPLKVKALDHISVECAFMEDMIQKDDKKTQIEFLESHILKWAPAYFTGLKDMAKTSFYRDLCSFAAEFFVADYEYLTN